MSWNYLDVGGAEMGRAGSNSTTSLSQGSDMTRYSPSSPRTPMSYDHPSEYLTPYSAVSYSAQSSAVSYTTPRLSDPGQVLNERQTPTTLGWMPNTDLVKLYKLMVAKGEEAHLELLSQWSETKETPRIVYLEKAQ